MIPLSGGHCYKTKEGVKKQTMFFPAFSKKFLFSDILIFRFQDTTVMNGSTTVHVSDGDEIDFKEAKVDDEPEDSNKQE